MAERGGLAPQAPGALDCLSTASRLAGPVHVPKKCPRQGSHLHWPRFELGASADWAARVEESEAGRDTPRGCGRVNFRGAEQSAVYAALVLSLQSFGSGLGFLFPVGGRFPIARVVAAGSPIGFQPVVQFCEAGFNGGIDVGHVPDKPRLDAQFKKRWVVEFTIIARAAPFPVVAPAKVWVPWRRAAESFKRVVEKAHEGLLDLDHFAGARRPDLKIRPAAASLRSDDGQDGGEHLAITAAFCMVGERIETPPASLDWLRERNDGISLLKKRLAFGESCADAAMIIVVLVEHWVDDFRMVLPAGFAPALVRV
jgi:hypothetical protein